MVSTERNKANETKNVLTLGDPKSWATQKSTQCITNAWVQKSLL